jgi:hypothetical protein
MSRTKAVSEELQTVHWKALKTNPYLQPLAAQMLNKGGLLVKKKVKLKGTTQYDEPEEVLVHYDSNYFSAKVTKTFEGLLEDGMSQFQVTREVERILLRSSSTSNVEDDSNSIVIEDIDDE